MFRCKPLAVAVFAMWTTFVWVNRIYNIVAKDGGDGVDLARAVAFVVLGVVVAVVAVGPFGPAVVHRVVSIAGWASIALWVTRIVTIPMGDYSVGFVVVHLVLGAVSVALALWAMRTTRALAAPDGIDHHHRPSTGPDAAERAATNA